MKLFEIIIAAALFSFYFIDMARFPKKWKLDFKPFNCLVCLPAWIALALYFLPTTVTEIVIVMMAAVILSVIIKTLIYRI